MKKQSTSQTQFVKYQPGLSFLRATAFKYRKIWMPSCTSNRWNRQSRSSRQLCRSRKGDIIPKVTYGGKRERSLAVIWFLGKNRHKATLPPKSGENALFFEKEIAKIERVLKLFGESVATGLPVGDSCNGQIIKLLSIMSHILIWDSCHLCYTADLRKEAWD
jgi:hypothetical protein